MKIRRIVVTIAGKDTEVFIGGNISICWFDEQEVYTIRGMIFYQGSWYNNLYADKITFPQGTDGGR